LRKTKQETEIKLELPDAATGRKLLKAAGFRVAVPRGFESNVIFDTPDSRLRSSGMLLRIRSFRGTVTLTLKGRSQSKVYKSRAETETTVSSREAAFIILEGLGYSPQFVYEKYRTEYHGGPSLAAVLLDETPMGAFFEIEGNPGSIDAAARALGFSRKDYITASYSRLFGNYSQLRKIAPGNMVFTNQGRRRAGLRGL
jgi:adenylate cyclase, class 2